MKTWKKKINDAHEQTRIGEFPIIVVRVYLVLSPCLLVTVTKRCLRKGANLKINVIWFGSSGKSETWQPSSMFTPIITNEAIYTRTNNILIMKTYYKKLQNYTKNLSKTRRYI